MADRSADLPLLVGRGRHSKSVTDVQIGKHFFITSSKDGDIKLWDLKTGSFIRNLMRFREYDQFGPVIQVLMLESKLVCCSSFSYMNVCPDRYKVWTIDFNAKETIVQKLADQGAFGERSVGATIYRWAKFLLDIINNSYAEIQILLGKIGISPLPYMMLLNLVIMIICGCTDHFVVDLSTTLVNGFLFTPMLTWLPTYFELLL